MAIAFVQAPTSLNTTGTSTSFGAITVGSGNFLYVGFRFGDPTTTPGISDNNSGSWSAVRTFSTDLNGNVNTGWYSMNHPSGSTTVTITSTNSATLRGSLFEFSGVATTSALDQQTSNVGSDGTAGIVNSGDITTTQTGELVLSLSTNSDGWGSGPTTGFYDGLHVNSFISPSGGLSIKTFLQYLILPTASTGSGNSTGNLNGPVFQWYCDIESFKAAGATNSNFLMFM